MSYEKGNGGKRHRFFLFLKVSSFDLYVSGGGIRQVLSRD